MDAVLVAYASWTGSTEEVAEVIADVLRDSGARAEVRPASDVDDLDGYGAVVLGTAVRAGRVHRDAVGFTRRHRRTLARLPVAHFVVCMTMKDDTEESRATSLGFLKKLREEAPEVEPVDVGLFAGALPSTDEELKTKPLAVRLMMKMMKVEGGDFRDWAAIKAWAGQLSSKLAGGATAGEPAG